jgi:hypothetical protein
VGVGCAPAVYTKWGATPEQTQRDTQECEYQADVATINLRGIEQGMRKSELTRKCMALRGYSLS